MEIWKPIQNFPSYNVSSEGRIMNVKTQRILIPSINDKGQYQACLSKNNVRYNIRIHRVVAETFLGENPDMDVIHKDGDRLNNRVENLEWCTRSETLVRTRYRKHA